MKKLTAEQSENRIAWALTYALYRENEQLIADEMFWDAECACALGMAAERKEVSSDDLGFSAVDMYRLIAEKMGISTDTARLISNQHEEGEWQWDNVQGQLDNLADCAIKTN